MPQRQSSPRHAASRGPSRRRSTLARLAICLLLISQSVATQSDTSATTARSGAGSDRCGFRVATLYEAGGGALRGAAFVHISTGIPIDLFATAGPPQAILYLQSLPVSEAGEPWIAQRLLLDASRTAARLAVEDSAQGCWVHALTTQSRTIFHIGQRSPATGWTDLLARLLSAIVNPAVSNAQIREMTWWLDVTEHSITKLLQLEERGELFHEASRRATQPREIVRDQVYSLCYGREHPMGLPAHGTPDALRALTPDQLRAFLNNTYYPDARVGLILFQPVAGEREPTSDDSLTAPAGWPPDSLLNALDAMLRQLRERRQAAEEGSRAAFWRRPPRPIPAFSSRDASALYQLPFPAPEHGGGGIAALAWRPRAGLDAAAQIRRRLLWKLLAGRLGALELFPNARAEIPDLEGHPPLIWTSGDAPGSIPLGTLLAMRAAATRELTRIASLPAGSDEFAALRRKALEELETMRQRIRKRLRTTVAEGDRDGSLFWVMHRDRLGGSAELRQDLELEGVFDDLAAALDTGNPWAGWVARLGLQREPYVVAARCDTTLAEKISAAESARLMDAAAALQDHYGAASIADALQQFREHLQSQRDTVR